MIHITEDQRREVLRILLKHVSQYEAMAFGSRVRGNHRRYSDLDIALIGAEPLTLRQFGDLEEDFQESDLPFHVDVVEYNAVPPWFRKSIDSASEKILP